MQIEQIDRDAAQSILDTWWNRSKIEAILAEHRLAALSARPVVGQGCICPPTSEKTCRGQFCPRKPISY